MPRQVGERLPSGARRRAIRQLQSLVAAGVSDDEAREQVMERYDVSGRSARYWLKVAYEEMAAEAAVDRRQQIGAALRRRRLAMARAAKDGDWRTYLAAADSEAKLLGLNAPVQTEHHVLVDKVQDMSRAVVDVVKDFFAEDPVQRARFVEALRVRLNAQLAERPDRVPIVIDGDAECVQPQLEPGTDDPSKETPTSSEGTTSDGEASGPRLPTGAPAP